jgi:hypothetical protein
MKPSRIAPHERRILAQKVFIFHRYPFIFLSNQYFQVKMFNADQIYFAGVQQARGTACFFGLRASLN